MNTPTATPSSTFAPSEWRMTKEFRHSDGYTYSLGEPVPMMTAEEVAYRERDGFIVRADAPQAQPTRRVITPEFLLAGNDLQVLRRLREHKVDKRILKRVFALAVATQRSHILLESLRLILGIPAEVEAPPDNMSAAANVEAPSDNASEMEAPHPETVKTVER